MYFYFNFVHVYNDMHSAWIFYNSYNFENFFFTIYIILFSIYLKILFSKHCLPET